MLQELLLMDLPEPRGEGGEDVLSAFYFWVLFQQQREKQKEHVG